MAETWLFKDLDDLTRKATWLTNVMNNTAVTIIGTYDELVPILNHIIKHTDFELRDADFMEPEWTGYNKEYEITLDSDKSISVEKAFVIHEDGSEVAILFDTIIFAYKDVDERILKKNEQYILFDIDDGEKEEATSYKSATDRVVELLEKTYEDCNKNTSSTDLFDLLFS